MNSFLNLHIFDGTCVELCKKKNQLPLIKLIFSFLTSFTCYFLSLCELWIHILSSTVVTPQLMEVVPIFQFQQTPPPNLSWRCCTSAPGQGVHRTTTLISKLLVMEKLGGESVKWDGGAREVTEIPVPRDHEVPVCSANHAIMSKLQL